MADEYERRKITGSDIIDACEVLLLAGFTDEAMSVLACTLWGKGELHEALEKMNGRHAIHCTAAGRR